MEPNRLSFLCPPLGSLVACSIFALQHELTLYAAPSAVRLVFWGFSLFKRKPFNKKRVTFDAYHSSPLAYVHF